MKGKWNYILEAALVAAAALLMFSDIIEVESCGSGGGRWNEAAGQCDAVSGWSFLHHGRG